MPSALWDTPAAALARLAKVGEDGRKLHALLAGDGHVPVTEINVADAGMGGSCLRLLAEALQGGVVPSLQVLVLAYTGLRGGDAGALAAALPGVPRLTTLSLLETKFGARDMVALAGALSAVPLLTALDVSDNCIGDDGATALAAALRGGAAPQLGALHVNNNDIGAAGVSALAAALRAGAASPSCAGGSRPSPPPAAEAAKAVSEMRGRCATSWRG